MITTSLAALPSMSNLESLICVFPGGLLCFCAWLLFGCRVAPAAWFSAIWYLGSFEKLFWDVPWELEDKRCLSLPEFIRRGCDSVRTCSLIVHVRETISSFLSGCCFWSFTRDGFSPMVPFAFAIFLQCLSFAVISSEDGCCMDPLCLIVSFCLRDSQTLFGKPLPSLRVALWLWWLTSVWWIWISILPVVSRWSFSTTCGRVHRFSMWSRIFVPLEHFMLLLLIWLGQSPLVSTEGTDKNCASCAFLLLPTTSFL